jgi:sugar phosphate isomerase/epimerase
MKIGLHSVSYSGTWGGQACLGLDAFIRKTADLGFEAVELAAKRPHASPLDMGRRERKAIRSRLEASGMLLSCMASYHDFAPFFAHGDMAYLEKELVYLDAVLEMSKDLGAGLVRVYTGYAKDGVPYRAQWERCVAGIKEGARRAAGYGISLGVQNHSCIACHPDSLLDFLAEVDEPNVKVILDAPYIANLDLPLRETVLKFKGLVAHSHLTDFIRRQKYRYVPETVTYEPDGLEMIAVPVGRGSTDYREFIAALVEIGYDGVLSYEMCSPLVGGGSEANLDRTAKEALSAVREILAATGARRSDSREEAP